MTLSACRHLSKGHFSDDNQKRLSKTSSKVPIYEAKMTGDTRLVVSNQAYVQSPAIDLSLCLQYQVDCVADWQVCARSLHSRRD